MNKEDEIAEAEQRLAELKLSKKVEIATHTVIGTIAKGIGRGILMFFGVMILFAIVVIGSQRPPEEQIGGYIIFGILGVLVLLAWYTSSFKSSRK